MLKNAGKITIFFLLNCFIFPDIVHNDKLGFFIGTSTSTIKCAEKYFDQKCQIVKKNYKIITFFIFCDIASDGELE